MQGFKTKFHEHPSFSQPAREILEPGAATQAASSEGPTACDGTTHAWLHGTRGGCCSHIISHCRGQFQTQVPLHLLITVGTVVCGLPSEG